MAGTKNTHHIGLLPSIGEVRALGFDVLYQETYDRHRMFQAVLTSTGALVGDGATDDNYLFGFYTQDFAIDWLKDQTAFTDALSSAGGVTDSGTNADNTVVYNDDGDGVGLSARPTPGESLSRP